MYDEFEKRNIAVIAVAQEDKDLESHAKFLQHFKPEPRFEIVADLNRSKSSRYGRTTTYLIDGEGTVRQVFPNTIHNRASWKAVLDGSSRALNR
jgi:alkyl hydroperoxide reductase subunit AhpC